MQLNPITIFNTVPTYWPSIAWFRQALLFGNTCYHEQITYNRKWHANRTQLAGANGLLALSIPLVGGRMHKAPFAAMQISKETNWQKQHLRSIETIYRKAPFYEYYEQDIISFYAKPWESLAECNKATVALLCKCLKLEHVVSSNVDNTTPAIDFGEFSDALRYTQVFSDKQPFIPNCSMLDLLFCQGSNAVVMIKNNLT